MKKAIPFFVFMTLIIGVTFGQSALSNSISKPKNVPIVQPGSGYSEIFPVYNGNSSEIPSFYVHYTEKAKNVLVECIVSGVSFRTTEHSKKNIGKIVVWIDGKRRKEVSTAAFIIKGLSPGDHKIRLEVVRLNNEPYGLKKEFLVNIPK